MIYLDNAATTFPKPTEVIEATTRCLAYEAVNPGRGVYAAARQADEVIARTREMVKDLLGFKGGQVIFSPSATLALNQVLLGLEWSRGDIVYITPFEHNSVVRVLEHLTESRGIIIKQMPVDIVTLDYQLDKLTKMFFTAPPKVVVMTHASNVCGLITPIEEITRLAKLYEAKVIIDGAQGGPLLALTGRKKSAIDFYVFSGHKTFYGPFGVAGFWTNGEVMLKPTIFGGTGSNSEEMTMPKELPYRYEAGSHNIVAIAGLQAACQWLKSIGPDKILSHERGLVERLLSGLTDIGEVRWIGNSDLNKHVGIVSLEVESYTSQELAMALEQNYGIAVRAGLHCAPVAHKFIGTLPRGTTRLSFGYFNTVDEVDKVIESIKNIVDD